MTPEETRDRQALYRDVQYERISPAEADAQLRQWGQEPFQSRPDPSRFDPMSETEWTLPMAAAWFIWRSPDAVRDQWNPARNGWRKWVPLPPRRSAGPRRPTWKLIKFGPATLADVFEQARLPGKSSQRKTATQSRSNDSPARTHNPYDRLKVALQTGVLKATWGTRRNGDFEDIPRSYWLRKFDDEASQKRRFAKRESKPNKAETEGRGLSNSAWANMISHSQLPASNNLDPFDLPDDLPDLSLGEPTELPLPAGDAGNVLQLSGPTGETKASSDATPQQVADNFYDDGLDQIFMLCEDVQLAEREVSQREYEFVDWDLNQALGWVAYRKITDFRSLFETDLRPPPTYHSITYIPDFSMPDPVNALSDELKLGSLGAYLDGVPVPHTTWLGRETWDFPDVRFLRADILKIWKESDSVGQEKRGPVSMARARELYLKVRQENGGPIGVHLAFEKLKRDGVTARQVRAVAKDLGSTGMRGRKKKTPSPP